MEFRRPIGASVVQGRNGDEVFQATAGVGLAVFDWRKIHERSDNDVDGVKRGRGRRDKECFVNAR